MASRLATRIKALETANVDGRWYIVSCETAPTSAEMDAMDAAHAAGRFVVLFISEGDTAWCYGNSPKPWESVH